ncbi:glycoside hydrolase family 9 protein [Marinimicrobium alkaliphilum]|uniref:glycoside hydrolase family 9 protein n=1 Tax=Marinimicrobium alkaliphilum TaxID=2202654 RepID=UPI000DB9424A|nr:glycoside hydrolase family 9 protein [Marinimicrobium alkaliphilum]
MTTPYRIIAFIFAALLIGCSGSASDPTVEIPDNSSSSESSASSNSSTSSEPPGSTDPADFVTPVIVVDQFGYLPEADKIAVIRDPQVGFDADQSFSPGATYQLIDVVSDEVVYESAPTAWDTGRTADIAGDRVWWFDFSSVSAPGRYYVLDVEQGVASPAFDINDTVYRDVLMHAVRTFYYQRAGFAKETPYAEAGWTDAASHLGEGQDPEARLYSATHDAATERDLRGGWYDAGDYNKYTNWHADYLVVLFHAYLENPEAWSLALNIPESDGQVADLLHEIKWGMDWLIRMQEDNGSVLSVMGLAHASPPSSATGPSVYGPATTAATLTSAQAFALGATVFGELEGEAWQAYADDLRARAQTAWTWAEANPSVTFRNSDNGVAAGEQEVGDNGRALKRRMAAIYLFAATGESAYRDIVDQAYEQDRLSWIDPWQEHRAMAYLYYASLPNATVSVRDQVRDDYRTQMHGSTNIGAFSNNDDPYRAYIGANNFTWGSNRTMAKKGSTFYNMITYQVTDDDHALLRNAALGYLNYLHGVNPLGKVYLSNMYALGVDNSVDSFYHSWFSHGSPQWDRVGESTYGPAPGFLVGGPNPSYDVDGCCANNACGSAANNAQCTILDLEPPRDQPEMKSYKDFNHSWPINSWAVTENHNDYQVAYIRLLSKFVR